MAEPAPHHCQLGGTPWPGVHSVRTDSGRHFGRHWHATFGIGVLEAGAQRSASGRGQVDAYAGDMLACNPGEVHDGRPLGGASRRWRMVHLEPRVLAAAGGRDDIELTRPVIRDARLKAALHTLLARLDAWQAHRDDVGLLACEEALTQSTSLLLSMHATRPAPLATEQAGRIERVRERLGDAPLAAPTLDELAALAQLGKYQLLRRFTRAFGLPPHAWLLQQRVARAQAAIRTGASLAQAAAQSGFADQSHMTRVFARQLGFTPGAWRRALVQ